MVPSSTMQGTATYPPQRCTTFGLRQLRTSFATVIRHFQKHVGVGIVCSVAYFDPGNWGVDLQAGSEFGYRLLFIVLLAGIFGIFLQVLAGKLGCVTGLVPSGFGCTTQITLPYCEISGCSLAAAMWDYLASHCRLMFHDKPKHTRLWRWCALYPLYVMAEVAIISTDLAELLGSAIALCLLIPKLQLWQGVILTAFDVLILLALGDPLRGKPAKFFEWIIAGMVLAVLICMGIIIGKVQPVWADAFEGYVPSKYIFAPGGLYLSVGILGATVMPHSLYLGSALSTQDRISCREETVNDEVLTKVGEEYVENSDEKDKVEATEAAEEAPSRKTRLGSFVARTKESVLNQFRVPPRSPHSTVVKSHAERENNPLDFVRSHLWHGVVDMVSSLLGFALVINSLITILASAVFFYGPGKGTGGPASLFDAYNLIKGLVGIGAAKLFAIALLASGQSSSIIATVAGQAVAEGYIHWRVSPAIRRLFTRVIAIVPSAIIAAVMGKAGINALLVASQVILSITLPFVTFPLLYCTSSKAIMRVRIPKSKDNATTSSSSSDVRTETNPVVEAPQGMQSSATVVEEGKADEFVDYSNSILTTLIGAAIWLIIVAANIYVLVALGLGQD